MNTEKTTFNYCAVRWKGLVCLKTIKIINNILDSVIKGWPILDEKSVKNL